MAEQAPDFDSTTSVGVGYCAERRPFLAQLIDDDRIHDIPYKLLGPDFVYEGSGGHLHVGDTPWHGGSGIITWPLPHIKVSLYLDAPDGHNGCLRVIPGSHRNYLRHVDSRWAQAPDYMYVLRNRNTSADFRPYGLAPSEVPSIPLESQPGDVLVFTEDLIHGSFGGQMPRRQLTLNYLANPRTDEQIYYLRQRYSWGAELRPPADYVNSDRPRIRRMVARLVELGFESFPV